MPNNKILKPRNNKKTTYKLIDKKTQETYGFFRTKNSAKDAKRKLQRESPWLELEVIDNG